MRKIITYVLIVSILVMGTMAITWANQQHMNVFDLGEAPQNFAYINQQLLESSRYTQSDEVPSEVLDLYRNTYTLFYTPEEIDELGFDLMFQTPELNVYFEKDSFSMLVENRVTGYFWSSRPEFQGMSGSRENNVLNRNLMNSGLWFDYVRQLNVTSASVMTDSLYSLAEVSYMNDASITEANPDHLRPYELEPGTYSTRRVQTTIKDRTATQFTVFVDLKDIDISFDVVISLVDGAIDVFIPTDTIAETGDIYRLMAIHVFPYFGASREDKMPGYLVIPDGVGALVRTNRQYNTSFQARFYGNDLGYRTTILPELSLPLYGNVHEPGANGFYAHVLEGSEFSTLNATFWGTSTRYHRIWSRFNVRQIYRNIINQAGDGNDQITQGIHPTDYRIQFKFLSDQDASYVGIAKDYRAHLIDEGVLTDKEQSTENHIPIQLAYIMSDQEPSFIGTTKIEMTTSEQMLAAYQMFKEEGLENQTVMLFGWSRDGFVNRTPYRTRVWDRQLDEVIESIQEDGNRVFLETDYTFSSNAVPRINYNRDVARNVSRLKMTFTRRSLTNQIDEVYVIYPESSLAFAKDDVSFMEDLGVDGPYLGGLGPTLFSYYDGGIYYRSETIGYYQQIASLYDNLLLSRPNLYLYPYTSGYMDLPITNSQYDYYTDLIPLIPIVLKGSLSYYTPFLNFNALAEDRLLTMVDFGVNPSYVLTHERTFEMRYTPASVFYTTTLSEYEDEVVETYHYINDALKHVIGASIDDREVLETGLVKVTYSNDVIIYVNYTYETQNVGAFTMAPRSYEVVLP